MGIFSNAALAAGACVTGALVVKYRHSLMNMLSNSASSYTRHERVILDRVTKPENLTVTWSDVVGEEGLAAVLHKFLLNPAVLAMRVKHLPLPIYSSVLFYGPSGCGKTLIAKAMAGELGASVINLDLLAVLRKANLMSAVVSVAKSLTPCVVFIKHLDEILEGKHSPDTERVVLLLKTLAECRGVIVVATATKKENISNSILRTFPLQFEVPLPNADKRMKILERALSDCSLYRDVDLQALTEMTLGLSCSDLLQFHRYAVWCSIQENLSEQFPEEEEVADLEKGALCPLAWRHFEEAVEILHFEKERSSDSRPHIYI
ncbi:uncharacterized protein [Panulirus ornatus]|uniref:uncharacterized protein n=1 Tax=Panulirus ornatus TaxID=150431 RepID=UPI003A8C6F6C